MSKRISSGSFIAKIIVAACTMLFLFSCTWVKQAQYSKHPHFSSWNLSSAQKDSLNAFLWEFEQLQKKNSLLNRDLRSAKLDLAKANAEIENLQVQNDYLSEELKSTKSDLEYAERQFISFENRIQSVETKASAVAAQAEAKIFLDKMLRENSKDLDSLMLQVVKSKLAKSDACLNNEQYAAATYYARRALKIMEMSSRIRQSPLYEGETRIIAANKANLRKGPGTKYEVLEQLQFGSIVIELSREGKWSKIKTGDGLEGWIYASLIE